MYFGERWRDPIPLEFLYNWCCDKTGMIRSNIFIVILFIILINIGMKFAIIFIWDNMVDELLVLLFVLLEISDPILILSYFVIHRISTIWVWVNGAIRFVFI
jgi:hypothetical protein